MEANEQELANEAAAHRRRAELCIEAGELDDAIAAYEQALDVEPDLETTACLAELFEQRGSEGDLEQAADLYFTIGDVLGNPDGIDHLQRAIQLVPGHIDAVTLLESFVPRAAAAAAVPTTSDIRSVPAPRSGRTVVGYRAEPELAADELRTHDGRRIPSTPAPAPRTAAAVSVPMQSRAPSPVQPVQTARPVAKAAPARSAAVSPVTSPFAFPPQALAQAASPSVAPKRPSRAPVDPFAPAAAGTARASVAPRPISVAPPARASVPPSAAAPRVSSVPPARASLPPAAAVVPVAAAPAPKASLPPPAVEIGAKDEELDFAPKSGRRSKKPFVIGGVVALSAAAAAVFAFSSPSPAPVSLPVSSSVPTSAASPSSVAAAAAPSAPAPVAAAAPVPAPAPTPTPAVEPAPPSAAAEAAPAKRDPDVHARVDQASVKGGKLSDKQLASALDKADAKLERCYDATLEKKPRTEGRLTIGWTVSKSGRALGVRKVSGTFKDAALDKCTVQAIKTLRFPKPRRAVQVKLPLEYRRT